MFIQHLVNALSVGAVYALIAIGYNMVYGILEKLNQAHGDIYAVGCFVSFSLLDVVHPVIAVLIGCATGFVLNLIVERFAYRPVRNSGRVAPVISAVGIGYVMRNIIQLIWGAETFSFDLGIFGTGSIQIGNAVVGKLQIYILIIAIVLMAAISLLLKYSKWGQAIIGISQSIETSALMGIPVNTVIAIVYGVGGLLGVIGGLLFCQYYKFIFMGIGFSYGTMKAWMASILGGIGSLKGAIMGAMILGLSETMVAAYISSTYRDVFVWLIFIIFVIVRPQGMFPAQTAEKI